MGLSYYWCISLSSLFSQETILKSFSVFKNSTLASPAVAIPSLSSSWSESLGILRSSPILQASPYRISLVFEKILEYAMVGRFVSDFDILPLGGLSLFVLPPPPACSDCVLLQAILSWHSEKVLIILSFLLEAVAYFHFRSLKNNGIPMRASCLLDTVQINTELTLTHGILKRV